MYVVTWVTTENSGNYFGNYFGIHRRLSGFLVTLNHFERCIEVSVLVVGPQHGSIPAI